MKKIFSSKIKAFVLAMVTLVALVLCGCQSASSDISLLENSFYSDSVYIGANGAVTENIVLNYGVFNLGQTELNNVLNESLILLSSEKSKIRLEYNQKLSNETTEINVLPTNFDFGAEIKSDKVVFTLYFYTQEAWQYFTSMSGYSYTAQNYYRFFDYTRVDRTDMIGAVSSLGGSEQYFGNYLKVKMFDYLNSNYPTLLGGVTVQSVYTYVTPYSRRHTNADVVAFYGDNYFHIWNTTGDAHFMFYLNLARTENWYIVALAIAFFVFGLVLLISYFVKDKRKNLINGITIEAVPNFENVKEIEKVDSPSESPKEEEKSEEQKTEKAEKTEVAEKTEKTEKEKKPKKRIKTKDE